MFLCYLAAGAAQLLFVLVLWAAYLGTELWKARNERCTPGYFIAYGTQACPASPPTGLRVRVRFSVGAEPPLPPTPFMPSGCLHLCAAGASSCSGLGYCSCVCFCSQQAWAAPGRRYRLITEVHAPFQRVYERMQLMPLHSVTSLGRELVAVKVAELEDMHVCYVRCACWFGPGFGSSEARVTYRQRCCSW